MNDPASPTGGPTNKLLLTRQIGGAPGRGEYFSRDLGSPLTGTVDWSAEETPFFLKKGENPDNIKLNLVVEGKGTVWIDDIRLLRAPLK